jgi:hypothetical protein
MRKVPIMAQMRVVMKMTVMNFWISCDLSDLFIVVFPPAAQ